MRIECELRRETRKISLLRFVRGKIAGASIWLGLLVLVTALPAPALPQLPQPAAAQGVESGTPAVTNTSATTSEQQRDLQSLGAISGTVVDQAGAVAVNARLKLTRGDQSPAQEVLSGDNGQFSFIGLPAGPFQLTITAEGFEPQILPGVLRPGESTILPAITLSVATLVTDVQVGFTQVEIAQEQIHAEEQQRVLGILPNFYVTYASNPVALSPRQKFQLAWKSTIDPFTFVGVGAIAGVQQATDDFEGFGQGGLGYAKRFGAAYGNVVTSTYIGSAILPILLKQDPRYFYKGKGSVQSRLMYALASAVICKGDNMRWQPNYSWILGTFASGGISYLYYPESDRGGMGLVVQNSVIRLGETAFIGVLQEFVIRRLTPRLKSKTSAGP